MIRLLILALSLWASVAFASGVDQTHFGVPGANSTFMPDLQTFIKREPAARLTEMWGNNGFVGSGGIHGTVAALTVTPDAFGGYPGGAYTLETGSVTYNANDTCWTIVHRDMTGNLANFVRQGSTHYLVDCTSVTKPALPTDSLWLMEVTTNGTSVTAVVDLRNFVPNIPTYTLSELPGIQVRGRMAFVRDIGSAGTLYLDTGTSWTPMISSNPMTVMGDMIEGGTGGIPTRLPGGFPDQVLSMNGAGTVHEYKTITAGAGISVSNGVGSVTIAQTVFPPTGSVTLYAGTVAPSGWYLCDGTETTATTDESLFDIFIPNIATWGRGTKVGDFTCDASTDICTLNAHGKANADVVHVDNTGGALPTGLSTATKYYLRDVTLNTFKFTATSGGTPIDITATGSGTQRLYDKFKRPDARGRNTIGTGAGAGLTSRSIGASGGEELHTMTTSELVGHTHTLSHTHTQLSNNADGIGGASGGLRNDSPNGTQSTQTSSGASTSTTTSTGSTTPFNVLDPYIVFTYIIKR